jgi:hypothetical protein
VLRACHTTLGVWCSLSLSIGAVRFDTADVEALIKGVLTIELVTRITEDAESADIARR